MGATPGGAGALGVPGAGAVVGPVAAGSVGEDGRAEEEAVGGVLGSALVVMAALSLFVRAAPSELAAAELGLVGASSAPAPILVPAPVSAGITASSGGCGGGGEDIV